jgi:CRP/FNR family cyclic AMP-dependent transcriptional regulator
MPALNTPTAGRCGFPVLSGNINSAAINSSATYCRPVPANCETGSAADPAVRRLIAAHPALGVLPEQDRCALLRWSRIRFVKRQDVICRQGDPAKNVVLVLEGYVKLSSPLADGGEVFLEIASPGSCVGELLALHPQLHDADVSALSPCRLLMIDAKQFRQAFDRHPEGLLAVLRLASERLRRTTEQLMDSRARTAPLRLAKALLRLAKLTSSCQGNWVDLPLRLSQGEFGVLAGMSRELVNKQLGAWRDDGLIRMSGGTVASVDTAALGEMSGEDEDRDAERTRVSA